MIGSLAIATNLSKTFLTFELWWIFGTGLGMACVYTTVFMANWPWFGERRGMATGIMMAGFALGPVIQGKGIAIPILKETPTTHLSLFDGKITKESFFPKENADHVPEMLNTLAYVWCGILVWCLLLIHENPEVKINKEMNESQPETKKPAPEIGLKTSLKSRQFWTMFFMCFFGASYGILLSSGFSSTKIYNQEKITQP